MSLCDHCFNPGQCCSEIMLFNPAGEIRFPVEDDPEGRANEFLRREKLPFEIKRQLAPVIGIGGEKRVGFTFSCTKLRANGRCGIYKSRPDICRNYQPMEDELCAHYRGAEGDERNVLP